MARLTPNFGFRISDFGFLFRNPQSATRNQGIFSIEYAVLAVIVAAALITMGVYVKRGLSGKYRKAGDVFGHGRQYEKGLTRIDGKLD